MNAIYTSDTSTASRTARISNTCRSLAVFRRAHFGRWPTLRAYSARRHGDTIYEVAKWLRMSADKPYSVITWRLRKRSIRWHSFNTLAEAKKHMKTLLDTHRSTRRVTAG